jgi:hypothetical protein
MAEKVECPICGKQMSRDDIRKLTKRVSKEPPAM